MDSLQYLTDAPPDTEGRYYAFFERASDPILIMRGERFIDCNVKALDLYGCTEKSELVGQTPWVFSPACQPDGRSSRKKALEIMQRVLGGASQQFYWQHTTKGGAPFDAEVSLTSIVLHRRHVVMAIVRDVTEKCSAAQALRESERSYRLLAEHATDLISRHAPDGTFRYASPAAWDLLGYAPEDLIGKSAYALFHGDDIPALRANHETLLDDTGRDGTGTVTFTYRARRKDGSYTWLETTSKMIRVDGSNPRGKEIIAVTRDVSERVRQQALIERQAIRLGIISAISADILRAETPQGIAEAALARLKALVPFHTASVAEVQADQRSVVVIARAGPRAPRTTDQPTIHLSELGAAASLLAGEFAYVRDLDRIDGRTRFQDVLLERGIRSYLSIPLTVEERTIGMLNATRRAPGAFSEEDLSVLQEVSDLVAVALQHAHYREQLLEAKEQAEEMSRLKSAFLATMSHEIRTPLTSILGFAELLGSMDLSRSADEFAALIHDSGQRLQETLTSVLDLSQLEAGSMKLHPEEVDVGAQVQELTDRFRPHACSAHVALQVALPPQPIWAVVDRTALRRVINNLLSNAIKFTEEDGRVTVTLSTEAEAFTLTVADTGIGIDSAFIPHLFEAFKQESSGDARAFEGSGLGLAITKKLVDLMEGTIEVESAKGKGATFAVHLPLRPGC